jgi:hypothetical protein
MAETDPMNPEAKRSLLSRIAPVLNKSIKRQ